MRKKKEKGENQNAISLLKRPLDRGRVPACRQVPVYFWNNQPTCRGERRSINVSGTFYGRGGKEKKKRKSSFYLGGKPSSALFRHCGVLSVSAVDGGTSGVSAFESQSPSASPCRPTLSSPSASCHTRRDRQRHFEDSGAERSRLQLASVVINSLEASSEMCRWGFYVFYCSFFFSLLHCRKYSRLFFKALQIPSHLLWEFFFSFLQTGGPADPHG